MMDKLELKYIAPYLPYGLKMLVPVVGVGYAKPYNRINNVTIKQVDWLLSSTRSKIILRPLSDLMKDIEVNGKKFIPLYQLLWIGYGIKDGLIPKMVKKLTSFKKEADWLYSIRVMMVDKKYNSQIYQLTYRSDRFNDFISSHIFTEDKSLLSFRKNEYLNTINQSLVCSEIKEKLFEWHFDVFDLINKGLAIDINTLK